MRAPAVGQVVAVDRGDDDVIEPELRHRMRDVRGLRRIERARQSGLDVAEGAGARAGVAHDHHGGVAAGPALGDVGAARLLAHGDEAVLAQDSARLVELRRGRRHLHPDPRGLAQHRRVGPMGLLGVARALVEDGDHVFPMPRLDSRHHRRKWLPRWPKSSWVRAVGWEGRPTRCCHEQLLAAWAGPAVHRQRLYSASLLITPAFPKDSQLVQALHCSFVCQLCMQGRACCSPPTSGARIVDAVLARAS